MKTTLNIGASRLTVLGVSGRRVRRWAEAPLEQGLVKDGVVEEPAAVSAAVNALFHAAGVRRRRVTVSLSGLSFTYRRLRLPRLRGALESQSVIRAARKEIAMPLEDLYLAWQVVGLTEDSADVFLAGAPRTAVDSVVRALEGSGLRPEAMDLRALALARAADRKEALIVSLEPDSFDIVVVAGGEPAVLHTMIPRGGEASLDDNVTSLADELARITEFYASLHPEKPLGPATPLLLTGSLSSTSGTCGLVRIATGREARQLTTVLPLPPEVPSSTYAVNTGLALKKPPLRRSARRDSAYHDISLNLLPERYRAESQAAKVLRVAVPVTLAAAVALVYPAYTATLGTDAVISDLRAELEHANVLLRNARLAVDEATRTEARIEEAGAALETLRRSRQALGPPGETAGDLGAVTSALAGGHHFTSIELLPGGIAISGEAGSKDEVIECVHAIEATGLYSQVRIAEMEDATDAPHGAPWAGVTFAIVATK